MLAAVEKQLQVVIGQLDQPLYQGLYKMLAYHMGWLNDQNLPDGRGKRVRPLVVLLACSAAGGAWQSALPAAAAVELLHNFSLIHDDIEDNSDLRRGRPTVWARWGVPQALNAGDAQFTLAHLCLLELKEIPLERVLRAARLLQETCLALTEGQYLDISFESRLEVTLEEYWTMITGKTAALLAACSGLGAVVAGAQDDVYRSFYTFGQKVGLAFQAQDDLLGIWGDETVTGKSASSDLLAGKKSLPILYGLIHSQPFAARWKHGAIMQSDLPYIVKLLENCGAKDYTQNAADELTAQAVSALSQTGYVNEANQTLLNLAYGLLNRKF